MKVPALKDKYALAGCCSPTDSEQIVGYFRLDDQIKVHRHDCPNLSKVEAGRLVQLEWHEILAADGFQPGEDYYNLDPTDFAILKHHHDFDIDYSLKVARALGLDKQIVFDRHRKLRDLGLLERVEALMVQYRKKVVKNKWIKHRNHTYYRLADKGAAYLGHNLADPSLNPRE